MADEVPLAPGAVYGFRFWKVTDEGLLRSVSASVPPWVDGENVAACTRWGAMQEPRPPVEPLTVLNRIERQMEEKPIYLGGWAQQARARLGDPDPDHPRRVPNLKRGSEVPGVFDIMKEEIERQITEQARERLEKARELVEREWATYYQEVESYPQRLAQFREEAASHIAPAKGCQCGFYLVRDPATAEHYATGRVLIGVVQGYGRTQPFELGWRCEKAKIVALAHWSNWHMVAQQVYTREPPGVMSMGGWMDRHVGSWRGEYVAQSTWQSLVTGEIVDLEHPVGECPRPDEPDTVHLGLQSQSHMIEKVLKNYPGVRFTGDKDAMIAAWSPRVAA